MRVVSARSAMEASRNNKHSKWKNAPECAADRLLRRVCVPQTEPSFKILSDDTIFAVGSCFARNVEERLALHHTGVSSLTIDIPGVEIESNRKTGIVNKFNSLSMLQEFQWASGEKEYPDEAFLRTRAGLFYDPHIRRKISDADLVELRSRRHSVTEYFQRALKANVIVVTLGLAELWFDNATGLALNEIPDTHNVRLDPDRFSFCISDVNDNLAALEDMHKLLSRHGREDFKMVITTSPVPLVRTFTGDDIIVANMHAKSTLRVASREFALGHDNVDYYPSYEAAMLSDRSIVWADDQLHVSDFMVGQIIVTFLQRYGIAVPLDEISDQSTSDTDLILKLRHEVDRYKQLLLVGRREKLSPKKHEEFI
jgi:hypothetical protein